LSCPQECTPSASRVRLDDTARECVFYQPLFLTGVVPLRFPELRFLSLFRTCLLHLCGWFPRFFFAFGPYTVICCICARPPLPYRFLVFNPPKIPRFGLPPFLPQFVYSRSEDGFSLAIVLVSHPVSPLQPSCRLPVAANLFGGIGGAFFDVVFVPCRFASTFFEGLCSFFSTGVSIFSEAVLSMSFLAPAAGCFFPLSVFLDFFLFRSCLFVYSRLAIDFKPKPLARWVEKSSPFYTPPLFRFASGYTSI